jgi:hypothetical protein
MQLHDDVDVSVGRRHAVLISRLLKFHRRHNGPGGKLFQSIDDIPGVMTFDRRHARVVHGGELVEVAARDL